jgi:ribosomal protein L37AE/L43A
VDKPLFIERPNCPRCKSKNIGTSGNYMLRCRDCGKVWSKHYQPRTKIPRNNTKCKYCNSPNIISKGIFWYCKDCGKTFRKIQLPSRSISHDGIICKVCGSTNIISQGRLWHCKDCGKERNKVQVKDFYSLPNYTTYLNKRKTIILK